MSHRGRARFGSSLIAGLSASVLPAIAVGAPPAPAVPRSGSGIRIAPNNRATTTRLVAQVFAVGREGR